MAFPLDCHHPSRRSGNRMRDFPCRRGATAMASDKSLANVPLSHRYEPFLDARQRKREIIFVNLLQLQQQPLCFHAISGTTPFLGNLFKPLPDCAQGWSRRRARAHLDSPDVLVPSTVFPEFSKIGLLRPVIDYARSYPNYGRDDVGPQTSKRANSGSRLSERGLKICTIRSYRSRPPLLSSAGDQWRRPPPLRV